MPESTTIPKLDLKASLKKPAQWAIAAGLLMALVTLFMPNYYRSEARLLPVESKSLGGNLGGLASAAAAFGVSVPGGDGSDANFVDVLNSRWLREQLLRTEFHYHIRSWRFGAEREEGQTLIDFLHAQNIDRAVQGIAGVLSVSRDMKSKVITISAETPSPELSQQIVLRAGKLLEEFFQMKGRTRGGAKAAFADARLAESRREMETAEDTFRRFLEMNRNYQSSVDPSVRLKGSQLEADLRLHQQLVGTLAINREQALLEEKNDIPIVNFLDPGNLPIDKSRPARATIVSMVSMFVGAAFWVFLNRRWIINRLLENPGENFEISDGEGNGGKS